MKWTDRELAKLRQQRSATQQRSACPGSEELTRAAMGEMNETEQNALTEHLVECHDCAEELQIALSLQPWADEAAGELKAVTPPLQLVERQSAAARPPAARGSFAAMAIAASLLLVSLVFGGWIRTLRQESAQLAESNRINELRTAEGTRQIAELRKEIDELSQPQLNVPITDLVPRDSTRGPENSQSQRIGLAPGTRMFTVILNVSGRPDFEDYGLEVISSQGVSAFQARGLKKSPENTFTLSLATRLLQPGPFEFKLYGLNAQGQRIPIQNYAVELRYQK